jgi:hypothetical protein
LYVFWKGTYREVLVGYYVRCGVSRILIAIIKVIRHLKHFGKFRGYACRPRLTRGTESLRRLAIMTISPRRSRMNPRPRKGGKVFSSAHRISLGQTMGLPRIQPRIRHLRKIQKDTLKGITAPDIRRLARRGGVKRIRFDIYEETRGILKRFLQEVCLR